MSEAYNKSTKRGFHWHKRLFNRTTCVGPWVDFGFSTDFIWTDTLSGVKNPNWREQVRAIVSATTAMTAEKREIISKPFDYYCSGYNTPPYICANFNETNYSGDIPLTSFGDPVGLSLTTSRNRAIAKLYNKLDSLESAVKTGEDLGELMVTLRQIRRPMSSFRSLLTKYFTDLKKGLHRAPKFGAFLKVAADLRLEFNYGWNPLADQIAKSVVNLKDEGSWWRYSSFHARGKSDESSSDHTFTNNISAGLVRVSCHGTTVGSTETRFYGVYSNGTDGAPRSVDRQLGLTLKDALPTLWNLIPYSFVIDYFSNLGVIEQSYGIHFGRVRWIAEGTRKEVLQVISSLGNQRPAELSKLVSQSAVPGTLKLSRKVISRSPVSDLPIPSVQFTLSDMNGKRWLNLAALAVTHQASLVSGILKRFF